MAFSNPQSTKTRPKLAFTNIQTHRITKTTRSAQAFTKEEKPGQSLPSQQGAALVLFKQLFTLLQPSLPRSSYKQYYSASHLNSISQLLPTNLTFPHKRSSQKDHRMFAQIKEAKPCYHLAKYLTIFTAACQKCLT